MNKTLQHFSDDYLEYCRNLKPQEIVSFLEDFKEVIQASEKSQSQLISIKIPKSLLNVFKLRAKQEGKPYQSLIKQLMRAHLSEER